MKILCWNCRGLGNPWTVNALHTWVWRNRPNILFLMETMLEDKDLNGIKQRCGFSNGICLSSRGRSGGLGMWWRDTEAEIITYSQNHILIAILDQNGEREWLTAGIYGWPNSAEKHKTWRFMTVSYTHLTLPTNREV